MGAAPTADLKFFDDAISRRIRHGPGIAVRRTASLPLAYARPSTSYLPMERKDVDARHKAGHDDSN
jgi:hypothetical protein